MEDDRTVRSETVPAPCLFLAGELAAASAVLHLKSALHSDCSKSNTQSAKWSNLAAVVPFLRPGAFSPEKRPRYSGLGFRSLIPRGICVVRPARLATAANCSIGEL